MSIFFPPFQEKTFFLMFITGIFLGVVYDAFKVKRMLMPQNCVLLFIDDVLFSILFSVYFVFSVFMFNNGIIRWYEYFFCFVGFLAYRLTFSNLLISVFRIIIESVRSFIKKAFMLLTKPLLWVFEQVKYIISPVVFRRVVFHRINLCISKFVNSRM